MKFGEETGPVDDAQLRRLSLHARRRPDARRARCLFAAAGRLGQPARSRRTRRCRSGRRSPPRRGSRLRQGRDLRRADPRRACGEQSGPAGARPRVRDAVGRSDVSRAGMRARLVRHRHARTSSSCSACSRPTRPPRRSPSCWARRARRSSRRASTPSSPIWAAASAAAITRRSRSMSRWRRCSFPAVRCGSRTIAISSSRAASSGTRSRCARGSAIDRATGKISAFAADHVLDGGGLANFSASVATVGATAAIGIYDVPKVDVTTVALHSRGVTAGSMRGYGTLQTMTALEVLIDEAAAALPLDPIEFRRRNALKTGGRTMTGNPYSVSVRTPEILDKLEKHPIWQQRAEEKARGQQAGMLVGTGVACVTKDYGTGADCYAGHGRDRSARAGSRSTATMSRWAPASARRSPTGWRSISAASPTKSRSREIDTFDALGARHLRRSLHDGPGDAGRRAAQSALGAGDQHRHHRLDRRPCRDACGRRSRARHLPLRAVAGGARTVGHRADRSAGEAMGGGALEGRQLDHAGLAAAARCRRSPRRRMRAIS